MKDVTSTQGFERKDKMHFWEKLNKQKHSSSFTSNSKMVLSMNMSYNVHWYTQLSNLYLQIFRIILNFPSSIYYILNTVIPFSSYIYSLRSKCPLECHISLYSSITSLRDQVVAAEKVLESRIKYVKVCYIVYKK